MIGLSVAEIEFGSLATYIFMCNKDTVQTSSFEILLISIFFFSFAFVLNVRF